MWLSAYECLQTLDFHYIDLLQIRKISLIVTNADNNSLDFYYKQSFAEQEYISNHIWA